MTASIETGSRLGPYEIVAPLGAGGMGEVWKARDTRLDRSVAIKVLPADFAENAQLKLRFEREAKTISQLNHPHICTLYDVGDGYLVMELLEGESLADRIAKGPLPIDQVLRYGVQIAEALDKAHKAGIVHRDLKPGNVMITKSGAKLLDFGLAKPNETGVLNALTSLRTEKRNLTEEGVIVGTFQYMAPEQIEGGEVDARTDIFALGAVLYEMASGRRAFEGKSKASLIASILTTDPQPVSALQPMTPATFDRVVRKCLEKEPDDRWQSAADVATALRWSDEAAPLTSQRRPKTNAIAWSAAAVALAAALVLGGVVWRDASARKEAPPIRTVILPPDKTSFAFGPAGAPPAISPEGTKIVFGAAEAGKPQTLWLRTIDSLVPQQLAGTENGMYPFWSPDGRSIGFFDSTALKKIEVSGGAPVVLCNVIDGRGGNWSPDGRTIIFAGRYSGISRVSASGGAAAEVTKFDALAATHRWPEFLPDGRHFLFLACVNGAEDPSNAIALGSVDGGPWKRLIPAANEPHYMNGAIVFTRDGTLTAQPFDAKKLVLTGDPVSLKEQHIAAVTQFSRSNLSLAANGTLVYQIGTGSAATQLTWIDRSGKTLGIVGDPAPYSAVALGPDQKRLLSTVATASQRNIWMFDADRNVKTRITFNTGDVNPLWSPDGRQMIYSSVQSGGSNLILRDLTTGAEQVLLHAQRGVAPSAASWSSDGDRVLYTLTVPNTRVDIAWLSLGDHQSHTYLATPFNETVPRFSPDGKWVAYQSNESGPFEVYLAPFPPTGAKWQVSNSGGVVPRWRGDGKELYYVLPNNGKVMAVPISLGGTPQIGRATELFEFRVGVANGAMYDVTRDGQRFIVNARFGDDAPVGQFVVMQHFDNELREALQQ